MSALETKAEVEVETEDFTDQLSDEALDDERAHLSVCGCWQ